jgi:proteasome lid subunit RPN8/RPN11
VTLASVRLAASADAAIRRLAEAAYPHEGCGVLIGGYADAGVVVEQVTSGRNLWTDRLADRYDLDPADIQVADRLARSRGRDVVGFWHSHPDHPARPSQFDSDRAWVDYAYLIVGTVAGGSGELNAFSLEAEGEGLRPIRLDREGQGS